MRSSKFQIGDHVINIPGQGTNNVSVRGKVVAVYPNPSDTALCKYRVIGYGNNPGYWMEYEKFLQLAYPKSKKDGI